MSRFDRYVLSQLFVLFGFFSLILVGFSAGLAWGLAARDAGRLEEARSRLEELSEDATKRGFEGVVAATSGNYGAAVASQAAKAGLRCIVVQEAFSHNVRLQEDTDCSLDSSNRVIAYPAASPVVTVVNRLDPCEKVNIPAPLRSGTNVAPESS